MSIQPDGAELISAERQRQKDVENYYPEHDQEFHSKGELASAAICYALPKEERGFPPDYFPVLWPWGEDYWKPTPDDRIRELVKSGALIAAEIDRLQNNLPKKVVR